MASFSISNGDSTDFTDTTPNTGFVIDFASLDNSFSVQINGVELFVGGPAGAPNEAEFQISSTPGQTVRFADGDRYEINTPAVWQLGNSDGSPVVRLEVNPDGTISFFGVKANNGTLEPLELFNGMSVNTAAIQAAWNDTGTNTIEIDQLQTGPTNASGDIEDAICFASGTRIETANGPVTIDDLKVADLILTYDHGPQPIRWIGSITLTKGQLDAKPRLKPIRIRADALGAGFPKHDLIVSPQHRVLVSSAIAQRMFNSRDVLIPANKLLPLAGVDILDDPQGGVTYFHILFDTHQIVWSNGTPTESLFTGPEALKSVSPAARQEIIDLFPQICTPDFAAASARHIPKKGKRMRNLVARHQANNKPLFLDERRAG
ncbi:Hint domain-containing protein [Shimia abyssi]|uniref:Hint domain-containing protein n=1 Tax=Shimia abyssi TaxID=1662395 RepID=A0A2P8FGA6_9RHOB|nr:Hint domain-containing protein [Shimia abyssi]PSL20734.1 Hint domain-containing protein [Shimia abyssi]